MLLAKAALVHRRRLRRFSRRAHALRRGNTFALSQRRSRRSVDEVDWTGPRLMSVGLRDAQINRQVGAAGKTHLVVEGNAPAPVGFGERAHAQLPAKAAAIE